MQNKMIFIEECISNIIGDLLAILTFCWRKQGHTSQQSCSGPKCALTTKILSPPPPTHPKSQKTLSKCYPSARTLNAKCSILEYGVSVNKVRFVMCIQFFFWILMKNRVSPSAKLSHIQSHHSFPLPSEARLVWHAAAGWYLLQFTSFRTA